MAAFAGGVMGCKVPQYRRLWIPITGATLYRNPMLNTLDKLPDDPAELRQVLERIAEHKINRLDQLMPWNYSRERTVCSSCQGVITQFREMFPNVNLIVRAGGL